MDQSGEGVREREMKGGREDGKGEGGGGGEVSVAWPGQGWNWGREKEMPPVYKCTGLVSGMVLAQPQPPPCPPAHPSVYLPQVSGNAG